MSYVPEYLRNSRSPFRSLCNLNGRLAAQFRMGRRKKAGSARTEYFSSLGHYRDNALGNSWPHCSTKLRYARNNRFLVRTRSCKLGSCRREAHASHVPAGHPCSAIT